MRIRVGLYLLASAIVILIGQVGRELLPPDDLREAEIAREMYEGGDYIVPRFAGLPFVEKPSAFPAVLAMAYGIVGKPSAAAAHLTAAIFALASIGAVFFLGWRILGVEGGSLAAAILAFSRRFCLTAHKVLLDNALTAAIAFTVLFTWIALEATDARKKNFGYAAAGFSLGVSFLFKGFVGPAIFGSGFILYLVMSRRFDEFRQIFRPLPIIAFVVPALSWVVPFLLQAPSTLIREFFIIQHLGRFAFRNISHKEPVYFYLLHIWPEFGSGSILLPSAIWMAWKTRKEWENRSGIFFLCLCVGPLALLSASISKIEVYFLPVHPALAMLVAWTIVKGWSLRIRGVEAFTQVIAAIAILLAAGMVGMTGILGGAGIPVIIATTVFILSAAGCLLSIRRNELHWISACIAALIALAISLWFSGPIAEAEIASRSIHRPMMEAFSRVGNRDIVLYLPGDGIRGAASFYRNRTAQEIRSPTTLVARLIENQNKTVALVAWIAKDAPPPGLYKAAQAVGINLRIEEAVDFHKEYVLIISAKPQGQFRPKGEKGDTGTTS